MAAATDRLFQILERRGIAQSSDIQHDLDISQATVSRLIKAAGTKIFRLGKGRNTRYSLLQQPFTNQPLYRIDPAGVPEQLAELAPLIEDRYAIQTPIPILWLVGFDNTGLFDGLPYFLDDLRPQGFLGRRIARQLGAPYPADPRRWSGHQILMYLLEYGADLPGDLVLGARALAKATQPLQETPVETYPELAEQVLTGPVPGSSAGGEQPKFTAFGHAGHVIVKFSPRAGGAEANRWRDILIAEHLAGQVLKESGFAVAESRIHDLDGRIFLEVVRFDREGNIGRHPMISLASLDAEFVGLGDNWVNVLLQLNQMQMVDKDDVWRGIHAYLFGQWIGNTDMHLGNLSLCPYGDRFRLLPLYDMAPMRWAPVRGELPQVKTLTPPVRDPKDEEVWFMTGALAAQYWGRLADDESLSSNFRRIADDVQRWITKHINR